MSRFRRKEKTSLFSKKNMLGLFIVLIMTMSGIGYMVTQGDSTTEEYNGYKFTSPSYGVWVTKIDGKQARFRYFPGDIDSLPLDSELLDLVKSTKMVYLTYNPDDEAISEIELARLDLENQLPQLLKIYPVTGVTNVTSKYYLYPYIDCQNATASVPVIVMKLNKEINESRIGGNSGCILLEAARKEEILLLKDRFVYGLIGIIK
ncbi:MAG: hypothetical protein QXK37_03080 [Candidatus Woesearchaeota archaeon]